MKKLYLCIWCCVCTLFLNAYAQQPINNWRLIPSLINDSQANSALVNNLAAGVQSPSDMTIAAGTTRTLMMKLPAVPKGGMMTFSPLNNSVGLQVNTFQSLDGKKWVTLKESTFGANESGNLQKADIFPSDHTQWFKVEFVNTSSVDVKIGSVGLYNFKTSGTSKNPYFLLFGASITVSSGGNAEWLATLKARVGNYDAVFFNLAVSGDNTSALYSKVDGFLAQHPNAGYVLLEIGGNDVSAQRVMTFADYKGSYIQTMDFQIREIIKKIINAGKDFALSRISYRNYPDKTNFQGKFQPSVNNGLNQENGSLPYNFIIDKIIKETNPLFWNESERRGVIDFYQYTLNNQQWLVAGDGVHFYGTEAFHIRDFWADYALKYFFTGQRSAIVPYTEYVSNLTTKATQAVVNAEAVRTEESVFNARILVEQLNSTSVRIPLLDRLDAILGQSNPTPPLSYTVSQINIANCFGDASGSISVTASGGTAPYQFSINNSAFVSNGGLFNNLTAGTYNILIKDNAGKTATVPTITITQPTALVATAIKTDIACAGTNTGSFTINASGGTIPYSFSLNGAAFDAKNTFSNLSAGTYNYAVKDSKGCLTSGSITISSPTPIIVALAGSSNISCSGGNDGAFALNVSGGIAPYQFSVNGSTFFSGDGKFNSLAAGNYAVTVKDANGCMVSVPAVTITQPVQLTASATKTDVNCNGNNGSITLTINGGTSPYQISINNGSFIAGNTTLQNLASGNYNIRVKDAKGCTISIPTIILSQIPAPIVSVSNKKDVSCAGGNDGSFTVNVSGGATPYQFAVNTTIFTTQSNIFSNLKAGIYSISVKDGSGCVVAVPAFEIREPAPVAATVTQTDIVCAGTNTGSFTINASGGTIPYSFSLNGAAFDAKNTFSNLSAGTYNYAVKDSKGCLTSGSITISSPTPIIVALAGSSNISCSGGNDGAFALNVSGGIAPYQFSVNGSTFFSGDGKFNSLAAGSYEVVIKDAKGCIQRFPAITLTEPEPINIVLQSKTTVSCNGGSDAKVVIQVSGGTPGYHYFVNDREIIGGNGTFSGLAAGIYKITIKDAKNCSQSLEITISEPQKLTLVLQDKTGVSCYGGSDGKIFTSFSGGTAPYLFSMNGSEFTSNNGVFSGLKAGKYAVTVKDSKECIFTLTDIILAEPAPVSLSLTGKKDVSCFASQDGAVSVNASGGTLPYLFSIDNQPANTTGIFSNLAAGRHIVVVTDSKGCSSQTEITLNEPQKVALTLTGKTNITCFEGKNGVITAGAAGGILPYHYFINNQEVAGNGTFSDLPAGTYTVFVKDANGCSSESVTVTLSQPSAPLVITLLNKTDISCFGTNDGKIVTTASGGTSDYSYFIDNQLVSNNTGIFTQVPAGKHLVTVQDAGNCVQTMEVNIIEAPELIVKIKEIIHPASTGKFGQIVVTTEGGHGNFEYSLNGGSFVKNDGIFKALLPGMYKITVKDGQGCVVSTNQIVLSAMGALPVTVSLSPNPSTTGFVKVSLFTTDFITSCLVQINDFSGKILYEKSFQPDILVNGVIIPGEIPLRTGIYILTIRQGSNFLTTRFVID